MSDSSKNGLPFNPDIERLVLGSVLRSAELMGAAKSTLEATDFLLTDNQKVWQTACAVYESGTAVDRVSVFTEAKGSLTFESLMKLDEGVPDLPNIDTPIRRLKELAERRRIIYKCQNCPAARS
jgi:replicative DNA helicase